MQVASKNYTVLKLNEKGQIIKNYMVCLTRQEAEGVARLANKFNAQRGVKDYFRVKEEAFQRPQPQPQE